MKATRLRMAVIIGVAAVVAAFVVLQVQTDATRNDFSEPPAQGGPATVVIDAGQWRAEVEGDCLRIWANGQRTQCWSLTYPAGSGGTGRAEGFGHRIRWVVWASDAPLMLRWWSSTDVRTERYSADVTPGLQLIAFELGDGEDFYGFQLWEAGGALLWAAPDR